MHYSGGGPHSRILDKKQKQIKLQKYSKTNIIIAYRISNTIMQTRATKTIQEQQT
jgi:hypothetical protein